MKILITGSSGFVGNNLSEKIKNKHQVVKFDLKNGQDILSGKDLTTKLENVDLVVHLAAFISASESWKSPGDYFRNNVLGTLSVLESAIKSGVKKIIFFSSAAVKAEPLTPYAVSKISAEYICNLYKDKINVVIVRPENIYGPKQMASYGYVIHNFIRAINGGGSVSIYGDGNQSRDFIYVDDVVKVVEKLVDREIKSGTVISIGTGRGVRINELASKVSKNIGKPLKVKYLKPRVEPRISKADLAIARSLDIIPGRFIDLDSGIKKLIKIEYSHK